MKFVGYSFAAHDGDRIAGKGKWRWDVEWKEGCGEGEGGCGLRRVAGESVESYLGEGAEGGYRLNDSC